MATLPVIDRGIRRLNVTDMNKNKRGTLKQALSDGAVYVLVVGKVREDIGVVMGLDTYQQLTRDLHPAPRKKRLAPEPVPQPPLTEPDPENTDVNEGLDLPWQ